MGKTLGDLIRDRLEQTGQSQQDLADRLGVGQPSVNRWCTGWSIPADRHLTNLAKWLKKPAAEVRSLANESRAAAETRARSNQRDDRSLVSLARDVPTTLAQILEELAEIRESQARIEAALAKKAR